MSTSPASSKLLNGVADQLLAERDGFRSVEEGDGGNQLPALILSEHEHASLDYTAQSAGAKEGGQEDRDSGTRGKADIASILS